MRPGLRNLRPGLGTLILALLRDRRLLGTRRKRCRQAVPVGSTLDGKKVLPLRVRWIAPPHNAPARVTEMDYFIDGKKARTEHAAPYYYYYYGGNEGSYGNSLVTSTTRA